MSWNNIGGKVGRVMLQSLGTSHTLKVARFAYNLLGRMNNVAGKIEEPAILELVESIIRTQSIEDLDFSYNGIDSFAVYCLSYGLERTVSLKRINLTGNPIGSTGVRYLVKAVNEGINKQFTDFVVDDTLTETAGPASANASFEITLSEGDFAFDLGKAFDRLKLRKLLDLEQSVSKQSGSTFGQSFTRTRLDNGSKPWPLPRCESSWNWNWVIEPAKGTLRITFSLKHLKPQTPGAPSTATILEQMKKASTERKTISAGDFENTCKLLVDCRVKGFSLTISHWSR